MIGAILEAKKGCWTIVAQLPTLVAAAAQKRWRPTAPVSGHTGRRRTNPTRVARRRLLDRLAGPARVGAMPPQRRHAWTARRALPLLGLAGAAVFRFASSQNLQNAVDGMGSGEWSSWLNRDLPSGFGDDESITALRDDGLIPCSNPTEIECRTVTDQLDWDDLGQTLATQCTIDGGLVCVNADNPIVLGRRLQFEGADPQPSARRRLRFSAVEEDEQVEEQGGRRLQDFGSLPPPPPGPAADSPEAILAVETQPGTTQQRVTCADYEVRVFCPAEDACSPYGGMKHPTEELCCAAECGGYCGAVNCAEGPGGADACCANTIETLGRTCGSRETGAELGWPSYSGEPRLSPCTLPTDTTCEPCTCDLDGVVNGIDTMRPGCALHDGAVEPMCSVASGCNSMGARESVQFPGTKYRVCTPGAEPETDIFCPRIVAGPDGTAPGEWDLLVNRTDCVVLEDALNVEGMVVKGHQNIPVVGPNSGSTTYIIEHSYGAVVAARLRDAWLQSDCDTTDTELEPDDPERHVRDDGRFGTYTDPVARHGTGGGISPDRPNDMPADEQPADPDAEVAGPGSYAYGHRLSSYNSDGSQGEIRRPHVVPAKCEESASNQPFESSRASGYPSAAGLERNYQDSINCLAVGDLDPTELDTPDACLAVMTVASADSDDPVPACTYTPERIVYSDASMCKHRFYGDEWNITVTPLRPMETHIEVQRVDVEGAGWSYDGLRIEYTVCAQSATGEVTQGQGLWRPSPDMLRPIGGRIDHEYDGCKFYRTGECSPEGPREPGLDLSCTSQIREGWSGYCQCVDGRQTYHVGCENHAPFTCEQACRVPEDWLCDPIWYDDGQCDVSCGSSDPDCTREVTVPWARLEVPSHTGQSGPSHTGQPTPRRTRDSRGWS